MKEKIVLFVAGDYCPVNRVEDLAVKGEVSKIFNDLLPDIREADLSIVNLECVVMKGKEQGIDKTGPNLKAKPEALDILKQSGFDLVTLANNHIMDFGRQGLQSTIDLLKERDIDFVGAGMNAEEASKTKFLEIKGHKIAIVNVSENEFSTTTGNLPGAHALNLIENHRTITKAKKEVDHVILIIHGGHEMYQLPSPRMKETYRFYADAGASVIVNHHQHCYSGYEIYNQVPIFYGVGNFIFDEFASKNPKHTNPVWNEGYAVKLEIDEEGLNYKLLPYIQNRQEPGLRKVAVSDLQNFGKNVRMLNEMIQDDILLEEKFEELCRKKMYIYTNYLEPFNNKFLRTLKRYKVLPYFFNKRKRRLHLNLVRCESHKDILMFVLKSLSS